MRTAIEARGLSVTLGGHPILLDVDLRVDMGSLTLVVGPNGAGKSTLLNALLGWVAPTEGTVSLNGDRVDGLSGRQRAARLGWLPQRTRPTDVLRVDDVVMAARYRHTESTAAQRRAALEALRSVGVEHLAQRSVATLSGGEAQRVSMAGLVAQQADVWLLDEPANHLDPEVRAQIFALLLERWRASKTLVVVLHDIDTVAAHLGTAEAAKVQVLGLRQGRLALRSHLGDPHLAEALTELYGIPIRNVEVDGRRRFLVSP